MTWAGSRRPGSVVAALLLLGAVFFMLLKLLLPSPLTPAYVVDMNEAEALKNAAPVSDNEAKTPTVVYIALGSVPCLSASVEISLWHLYTYGQWAGHTIVVTDHADCLHLDILRPLLPATASLQLYRLRRIEEDVATVKMKFWKTQLLKVARSDVVVYMDVDVFVRTPIRPFIDAALAAIETTALSGATGRSTGVPPTKAPLSQRSALAAFCAPADEEKRKYGLGFQEEMCHSGVFVIHRQHSQRCMSLWQEKLHSGRFDRDQEALDVAFSESHGACAPAVLDARKWMTFPTAWAKELVDKDLNLNRTFVHFTRGYRMPLLKQSGLTLAAVLGLPPELALLEELRDCESAA